MREGWMGRISNITFVLGLGLTLYLFIDFFITRKNLPPRVCPVQNNRIWIIVDLVLITMSLAFSYLDKTPG